MIDNDIRALCRSIVTSQTYFNDQLGIFISKVIDPLQLKDTNFKRSFLSDAAVAVSFNLLTQIFEACSYLAVNIKSTESILDIAQVNPVLVADYIVYNSPLRILHAVN